MSRRYTYSKFYSWDTNMAYLVGLFASDGCLLNDGRHLNITSKDKEIILITQNILHMSVKPTLKLSGTGGWAYHFSFSDVSLYDFLLSIGLTPAKSKSLGPISVPTDYYADFLRGYFDGDGTVYGFWDKVWENSFRHYVAFSSSSSLFLEWLKVMNHQLIGVNGGSIKHATRCLQLAYSKRDARRLYNFMYYAHDILALARKRNKFLDLLQVRPYADKA